MKEVETRQQKKRIGQEQGCCWWVAGMRGMQEEGKVYSRLHEKMGAGEQGHERGTFIDMERKKTSRNVLMVGQCSDGEATKMMRVSTCRITVNPQAARHIHKASRRKGRSVEAYVERGQKSQLSSQTTLWLLQG